MNTVTLSSKFQICIPKELRDELHLKAGQQFTFIILGNCLQLVPKRELKDIKGILAGANINNIRDRIERQ